MDSIANQLAPINFDEGYMLGQQPHEMGLRSSTYIEFSKWLNVRLDLQGAELIDPTPAGTSESPAVIPPGPSDRKGKFEPEPGFYQGFPEVKEGRRYYFYWDRTLWKLWDLGELPQRDISHKLDKSSVTLDASIIPLYENLFDKNSMVKDGFEVNQEEGIPGWLINSNTTSIQIIHVNHNYPIYLYRGWTGSPGFMVFYGENGEVISKSSVAATFKSGVVNLNSSKNIYGFSCNIYNSGIPGSNKQDNINSFMVYSGDVQLSNYKNYKGFFNEIAGKTFLHNFEEIDIGIEKFHDQKLRELGYLEPVSITPKRSKLNQDSFIEQGYIGGWLIRKTGNQENPSGTFALKNSDGSFNIKTDGTAANMGLLFSNFFKPTDVGKTLYFDFWAKSISGKSILTLYAAAATSGNFINIPLTMDWSLVKGSVIVGSENLGNDWRLLLGLSGTGQGSVSEFEIREINLFFTQPNYNEELGYQFNIGLENFGTVPIIKDKLNRLINFEQVLLTFILAGDSLTDHVPGMIMYARDLSRMLRSTYGDGGGGIYDFGQNAGNNQKHASIDPDDANDTRGGTIIYHDSLPEAKWVNCNHSLFSTGSWLILNVTKPHTKLVILYYGGPSYGVFTYALDGGSIISVDTSLSRGVQKIELNVSDSAHNIRFECISGDCIIFGVDMQKEFGVRIHKCGNRGLHAFHYTIVDENDWKDSFASLGADAVGSLIGTNDRTGSRSPANFKTYVQHFVDMVKDVDPDIDILLMAPSNNGYSDTERIPMIEYVKQTYSIARKENTAFISFIPDFGTHEKIVSKNLFGDIVHQTTNGGNLMAKKIFEFIKP